MIAEPYTSLLKLLVITNKSHTALRGTNGTRLEQQLIEHVRRIANIGCLFLDMHAGNVLVRSLTNMNGHHQRGIAAEAWDSRLTDFDRRLVLTVPELSVNCRQLMMLSLLALMIACSPYPRAAFEHEIRRLAALPSLQAEPWCVAVLGIRDIHPNVSQVALSQFNNGSGGRAIAEFRQHHQTMMMGMLTRQLWPKEYGDYRPRECRRPIFGALKRRWLKGMSPL